MSSPDELDIQGFVLRGYNFPFARYLFLRVSQDSGQAFLRLLVGQITTGRRWDSGKPQTTVNIAFTYKGLLALKLPTVSLLSFPPEFVQGMKERGAILCDVGQNSSAHWDPMWNEGPIHIWLGVYSLRRESLARKCEELKSLMQETKGVIVVGSQDCAALIDNGHPTTKEHFGYTDGFSNPDYLGIARHTMPGQGKMGPSGEWGPLSTGELLLGYPDETGELPTAPVPNLLGKNGTFMVYRKLHQNVRTFREYLDKMGRLYGGGKEKLASKFIGRWRDGTPLAVSPDHPDPSIVMNPHRSTNFKYGADLDGCRCPIGAHIRRANPRDAAGFNGRLVNRRRISRRGMPYGEFVADGQPVRDDDERGIAFMALNANIARQFEYVCQQWIENGNDARQGRDKDILVGNHGGRGTFMIQGSRDEKNPPFLCRDLPSFVELRGGEYFFVPSMTALSLIASGTLDSL